MAIAGITSNYTGRKKDISIFQKADPLVSGPQPIEVKFGKYAKFCSGIQKSIQQYAVILLTQLTSQPNFPNFGTSFFNDLLSGAAVIDKITFRQLFSLANYSAINTLQIYYSDTPGIPEDEQIASASLSDVVIQKAAVFFKVTITTAAGESVTFLVPLPE